MTGVSRSEDWKEKRLQLELVEVSGKVKACITLVELTLELIEFRLFEANSHFQAVVRGGSVELAPLGRNWVVALDLIRRTSIDGRSKALQCHQRQGNANARIIHCAVRRHKPVQAIYRSGAGGQGREPAIG